MPNPDPPPPRPRRRYRLSPLGRAARLASIQQTQPWTHSTGPRTPDGKLAARQNGLKHGYYCKVQVLPETAAFKAFVRFLSRASKRTGRHPDSGPPVWSTGVR